MTPTRTFQTIHRFATWTSALLFVLIVVGSIVRTTGSGLACPDWPLCHGRLIPPFQFNVMIEWLHRLLALVTGIALFATAGLVVSRRDARARLGGLAALAVALYLSQALLGALTVWKLLDPSVVSGHLAVALLLFATVFTLARLAGAETAQEPGAVSRAPGLLPQFAVATLAIWLQAVLGGMVSTNHASLACPDWPTCNGEWFPPLSGLVGLHVAHRWGAYLLAALLATIAWRVRHETDPQVRFLGLMLPRLVVLQIAIGVANVLFGIPVWVSALHLAVATTLLAVALAATVRLAALAPAPARWTEARAR